MSSIISVDLEDYLLFSAQNPPKPFILKGLVQGDLGMLIAPPDSGKSNLCLNIAYELALGRQIIGVREPTNKKYRTLYWPAEDGIHSTFDRVKMHLNEFDLQEREEIKNNVAIWHSEQSILQARNEKGEDAIKAAEALDLLIQKSKDYDLLIIDTIREAIGTASEVEDDIRIKEMLKAIGREAQISVLAVHHPTKALIKGLEVVSTSSGSGLSCTMAYARCHFYIEKRTPKNGPAPIFKISQPKANFIPPAQRVHLELPLNNNLLFSSSSNEHLDEEQKANTELVSINIRPTEKRKPKVITVDTSILSDESKRLAEKARQERQPISKALLEKYKNLKK